MKELLIGDHRIGVGRPPFIIAEMSANHNSSLERALAIVEAAARCGVSALKIQTSRPENMTLNLKEREFVINDKKVSGGDDRCSSSTKQRTLPGNGINRYLQNVKSWG